MVRAPDEINGKAPVLEIAAGDANITARYRNSTRSLMYLPTGHNHTFNNKSFELHIMFLLHLVLIPSLYMLIMDY